MSLRTRSKTILQALAVVLLLASMAAAQVPATVKLEWIKPSLVGLPPARYGGAMVYDRAMGATLLFGGSTYSTIFGETWAFTKTRGWTQLTPARVSAAPNRPLAGLRPDHKNGGAFRRFPDRRQRLEPDVDVGRSDLDAAVPSGFASGPLLECYERSGLR